MGCFAENVQDIILSLRALHLIREIFNQIQLALEFLNVQLVADKMVNIYSRISVECVAYFPDNYLERKVTFNF